MKRLLSSRDWRNAGWLVCLPLIGLVILSWRFPAPRLIQHVVGSLIALSAGFLGWTGLGRLQRAGRTRLVSTLRALVIALALPLFFFPQDHAYARIIVVVLEAAMLGIFVYSLPLDDEPKGEGPR